MGTFHRLARNLFGCIFDVRAIRQAHCNVLSYISVIPADSNYIAVRINDAFLQATLQPLLGNLAKTALVFHGATSTGLPSLSAYHVFALMPFSPIFEANTPTSSFLALRSTRKIAPVSAAIA